VPNDGREYHVIWLEPGETIEALPDPVAREIYQVLKKRYEEEEG
jgi:hypothetical protein